jgi:hypothetical protein
VRKSRRAERREAFVLVELLVEIDMHGRGREHLDKQKCVGGETGVLLGERFRDDIGKSDAPVAVSSANSPPWMPKRAGSSRTPKASITFVQI